MMINESCKYSQSNEKKNTAVCLEAHFSTRVQESGPLAGITSVESDVNQSADTKAFEHLWKQPESLLRSGWGNAKKKKKKRENRKEAQRHQQHPRDSASHPFFRGHVCSY